MSGILSLPRGGAGVGLVILPGLPISGHRAPFGMDVGLFGGAFGIQRLQPMTFQANGRTLSFLALLTWMFL